MRRADELTAAIDPRYTVIMKVRSWPRVIVLFCLIACSGNHRTFGSGQTGGTGGSDAGGTSGSDAGGTSGSDAGGTSGSDAGGTSGSGGTAAVAGSGGNAGSAGTLPAAPAVTLSFNIKQLLFSWNAVPGADHYQLLQRTATGDFAQVGQDLTATSATLDIAVHLLDWTNAVYRVDACNGAGCTPSSLVDATAASVSVTGYFKESTTPTGDRFGTAVALSADGNTLAVGRTGAVYVFTRGSSTPWAQQAYVTPSNEAEYDLFGVSVALSADGNTLAVGAPQRTTVGTYAGAVYVFTRESFPPWAQQAYVTPSNAAQYDIFGISVALSADGNTLAAGAPGKASGAGAAYLFTRAGATWNEQPAMNPSNTGSADGFGHSVALSSDGSTLAVGAPGDGIFATTAGAVYVFTRSSSGWSAPVSVSASNAESNDNFGWSVALSGDANTLAVGATYESSNATGIGGDQTNNNASTSGAVYVFTHSASGWSQPAYLKASNTAAGSIFGRSLGLSSDGSTLAVGASAEASNAIGIGGDQINNNASVSGAVYAFVRSNSAWSQKNYVKASNTGVGDDFGISVSLSGDGNTLAVGADGEASNATGIGGDQTDNSISGAGAVYLY